MMESQLDNAEGRALKRRCDEIEGGGSEQDKDAESARLQKSLERAQTKANYFEMIQRNEKWEYPLNIPTVDEIIESGVLGEIIEASGYNEEDGAEEKYAERRHTFLVYLRDLTVDLRRGKLINHISIDNFLVIGGVEVEISGVTWGEETLPFWQQFADALVDHKFVIDYHEGKEFYLTFDSIGLPGAVLDILGDALQQTHFHKLQFAWNNQEYWGRSNFDFVVKCIQSNPRLNRFHWSSNPFGGTSEIERLYTAINSHPSLRSMVLGDCVHYNDASLSDILRKLKSKTLEALFLFQNALSNFGPTDMSDFLAANPALKMLSIDSTPINDEDVACIAYALEQNTSLRLLSVVGVTPKLDDLYSTIFSDYSMNAVHTSNHYCYIRTSDSSGSPFDMFNRYKCPIFNMRKKIFYLLSERHRSWDNAHCFDSEGIGIKHLPNILALLKPYAEHHLSDAMDIEPYTEYYLANGGREDIEVEPLSIAYEIMRSWRMPELYNLSYKLDASD
eukprot:scaffold22996_cov59-Cyclotella_meneghiniana.AAC.2